MDVTDLQLSLIEAPISGAAFLEGPAGAGKTTVGVERTLHLMSHGVRADSILVFLPQRNLGQPYFQALKNPGLVAGGQVAVLTLGSLAQKMVDLFWPLVAGESGFSHPDLPPAFLNLETAQYYMSRVVDPLIADGLFDSVTIDRNRLYSQVLDNLNKAAVVGFPHTELGERLRGAWIGEVSQARLYTDTQQAASSFRAFCLQNNLLDFSLRVELFLHHIWSTAVCREYLSKSYRHLIFDNLEEDTPATHDLLLEWLPEFDSALLIYDWDGGFRIFLGADPHSAYRLKAECQPQIAFTESFITSPDSEAFSAGLARALNHTERDPSSPFVSPPQAHLTPQDTNPAQGDARQLLDFERQRFHPEMLDWVADKAAELVHDGGTPAQEIVILAPFMSDSLRYALTERLDRRGIPAQSHRPSRALRDEPAARCLLTLAAVAHPQWEKRPLNADIVSAFIQAIEGLDLVRAQLLTDIVYRTRDGKPSLSSFDLINPDVQERITYLLGERYENLRSWLSTYSLAPFEELDYFFSRLFGEILSQPGYGFHHAYDAGQVAANLVDSARRFRWMVAGGISESTQEIGQEYIEMVEKGVVAAQYIRSWTSPAEGAVFLAPAYTFLMTNRAVDYQFWLNVGGAGWTDRLYQPLTHPYVLSRRWTTGNPWTDAEELESGQEALFRLSLGLVRRCRRKVFLGLSDLGESGYEMKGPFLRALQRVLQDYPADQPEVKS